MTRFNGKCHASDPVMTPQSVVAHRQYACAVLAGAEANPNRVFTSEKLISHAHRIADEMVAREQEWIR